MASAPSRPLTLGDRTEIKEKPDGVYFKAFDYWDEEVSCCVTIAALADLAYPPMPPLEAFELLLDDILRAAAEKWDLGRVEEGVVRIRTGDLLRS